VISLREAIYGGQYSAGSDALSFTSGLESVDQPSKKKKIKFFFKKKKEIK